MSTNNDHAYAIGIDTGGTYTDSVIIDPASNKVVATAKAPTTHYNLSIGIGQSLYQLFQQTDLKSSAIASVAVSTTLATNAVVENKGADVALLVAGPTKRFNLPTITTAHFKGGHNHLGEENEPLEMNTLVDFLQQTKGHADAYAVAAAMSINNPAHEQVMAKAISLIDPKPVFMSHEVSNRSGIQERAATAVLNARLMPVMQEFLNSMQEALLALGLAGNVSIIRGDAKPMAIGDTYKKAASTVASGPAATAWFGLNASPEADALIIDIGGTTTDITMIRDHQPVIDQEGSLIGQWHTQVDAVKMSTVGAGGDSHAIINKNGELKLISGRVQPLATSPDIISPEKWLGPDLQSRCISVTPDLEDKDTELDQILAWLKKNGPATPQELKDHFQMAEITLLNHLRNVNRLLLTTETGFTPTDALHVLGKVNLGDSERARAGAEILAKELGVSVTEFCQLVLTRVEEKIERAILDHLLKIETDKTMSGFFPNYHHSELFDLRFTVRMPLIGIGAAAHHLLPRVAQRLGTEIIFPEHYEVGNAVGAALMTAS